MPGALPGSFPKESHLLLPRLGLRLPGEPAEAARAGEVCDPGGQSDRGKQEIFPVAGRRASGLKGLG